MFNFSGNIENLRRPPPSEAPDIIQKKDWGARRPIFLGAHGPPIKIMVFYSILLYFYRVFLFIKFLYYIARLTTK